MRGVNFKVRVVRSALVALAVAACVLAAEETSAKVEKNDVGIELNKLSSDADGCQAYFVFDNQGSADYAKLDIDLVVFNSDNVFERRFAMSAAPLDAKKRTLRMFELKKMACDEIGSFLINGVFECQQGKRTKEDCVQRLVPSSRVDVKLTK
ncbi:MAG: hypothetical protein QNJ62_00560 [Methyloceanibacter sp.]|nr:hypothetical protein [Methyloceanibacter sp.]